MLCDPFLQVDDTVARAKAEGDLPLVGYKNVSARPVHVHRPRTLQHHCCILPECCRSFTHVHYLHMIVCHLAVAELCF